MNQPSVLNAEAAPSRASKPCAVSVALGGARRGEVEVALVRHPPDDGEPPCARPQLVAIRAREDEDERVAVESAVAS